MLKQPLGVFSLIVLYFLGMPDQDNYYLWDRLISLHSYLLLFLLWFGHPVSPQNLVLENCYLVYYLRSLVDLYHFGRYTRIDRHRNLDRHHSPDPHHNFDPLPGRYTLDSRIFPGCHHFYLLNG
ncbi:uncharacterized protein EV154DRAFT_523451 [Mucor mucedo]|uniref:uncharacterized protein n=1 Tax=Mucor mucedo TaxID=29922 RepID=UPI00221FE341|nr:uncharacterized protein EV154DRAFT_523451 [Mucor mucedo]KAI7881525.1 hypothetical protein EV154DRAFT_523451 [Mucor mucedo]